MQSKASTSFTNQLALCCNWPRNT